MSGMGLPSTTTANRGVSPAQTSKSSMIVSNVGGAVDRDAIKASEVGMWVGGWMVGWVSRWFLLVGSKVCSIRRSAGQEIGRLIYCLPAISTWKMQLSLPYLLEAINIISPMSALFTLNIFSVCWSSSGIDISYRPGLLARTPPLLRKSVSIINQD